MDESIQVVFEFSLKSWWPIEQGNQLLAMEAMGFEQLLSRI